MAPWAIGPATVSRRGRFGRFSRLRSQETAGEGGAIPVQEPERPAKARPASWLSRNQALWSRTLQPLRPLDAPRGCATVWDASWPLPRELTSAGRARRLVTAQLAEWKLDDLTDTAELLVSELVTNALCHTRGPLRLNLCARAPHLRCEVEDTDPAGPVRRVVDADAEGGRGTELLDLLAESWGSTLTATGKTMWFRMPMPQRNA